MLEQKFEFLELRILRSVSKRHSPIDYQDFHFGLFAANCFRLFLSLSMTVSDSSSCSVPTS